MNKSILTLTLLSLSLSVLPAQERISSDRVQSIARKLLDQLGDPKDAPLKIVADADHGDAIKSSEAAVLVLPDKNLTLAVLDNLGSDLVPIGHLYFKDIAPAKDGKVTLESSLRMLTLTEQGTELRIPLCLLAARKRDDRLELVLYGNGKTPLLQVGLRKSDGTQSTPIELSGNKQDEDSAALTLSILGKYKATLVVMKLPH